MKKVAKIVLSVFLVLYGITAIFLTACLLNYNDYKVTEFGKTSLIIVDNDSLKQFKKGSLLIVKKEEDKIKVGEDIIFYNTYNNQVSLAVGELLDKTKVNETENTYTLNGNYDISSQYIVGSVSSTKVLPFLGTLLGIFESRIGFLLLIIFPITLIFLYEVYILVKEIKAPSVKNGKEEKDDIQKQLEALKLENEKLKQKVKEEE